VDRKARGECGGQHVDQRIADKHGADHFLGCREQAVHELCPRVAFLIERMHARARHAGEPGFAQVEEPGHRDQEQDGRDIEADFEGHMSSPTV